MNTVRIYAMFEDIFTMDENGKIVSDFSLSDARTDYLLSRGFTPMITYAGIPAFLAKAPDDRSRL